MAGRTVPGESEVEALAGYTELFENIGIMVDAGLVLFPQTDASADVPEISEACWAVLDIKPASACLVEPAAPLEALITRWLRSSSEGIDGEQAIMVAQQEQRHTSGQHRPSCEKEQIFERLKILPPGREGGYGMHQENRAVADRFESTDRERHHEDCLDDTDDREGRAP